MIEPIVLDESGTNDGGRKKPSVGAEGGGLDSTGDGFD